MRRQACLLCLAPALAALTGCTTTSSFVHSDAALGRVVVYRNGIAYFERTAHIEGDSLRLAVPADKVDDFLKSLTVVDARTGEPAPIAYPTVAPSPDQDQGPSAAKSDSGLIDMKIHLTGPTSHDLRLSYVTEAPSWKPSYRVVLGKDGKVNVQAWAIVDNTSGEDWQDVQLGVGSSSALSFRFDLRSVRLVQRETLHQDDLFAQAPPMGGPTFLQNAQPGPAGQKKVMMDLSDDALAASVQKKVVVTAQEIQLNMPPPPPAKSARGYAQGAGAAHSAGKTRATLVEQAPRMSADKPDEPNQQANQFENMARQFQSSNRRYVIEGWADRNDGDKQAASLERANRAREQLIRSGLDPSRVVAVGNGERAGRAGGVTIVEAAEEDRTKAKSEASGKDAEAQAQASEPIGTSHFDSKSRMTVPRGTSAMVSILSTDTDGEVVYLYDAESPRGNASFPFRSVHVKNPTDSVLESGPVTVFGEGKFVGEGMADPIPARSTAFIPFALDRQIMVERKEADVDRIARIITVQRGVFSTEIKHTRRSTFVLQNRLPERATVYVKHSVAQGYAITRAPEPHERLGSAYFFRVDVDPGGKAEVVIEESTPVFRTTDVRAPEGMDLVAAYLSSAAIEGPLKGAVTELLRLQKEMADTEQRIQTTREAMVEYRTRMDELHAQIVTLKLVKTAGPLMQNLEKKLADVSDKVGKATIDLVTLQEKLMVARIKFQDGVADLSLEKKTEADPPPPPAKT